MKPYHYISVLALALSMFACTTNSNFVKTGSTYPQIDKASEVRIILEMDKIPSYTEIGTCEIKQKGNYYLDFGGAIEEARKIAMKNGGNIVILKEKKDPATSHGEQYSFIIGRLSEDAASSGGQGS